MRQVSLVEPGKMVLGEVPAPPAAGPLALLRVERVGVCGTDFHAFQGRQPFFTYPRVLGHELSGTVLSVPEGETRVRTGDRCAVRPFVSNPDSRASRRGQTNCCEDLRVLGVHVDGGMGELLAVGPEYLHVSSDLSLDQLAVVEPHTIGCHAVDRGQVSEADEALVVGAGPIGLAVLQFALLTRARVTVVDLAEGRLDFVRRHFPLAEAASALDPARRFDCVFDATGSASSMQQGFGYVTNGGRLVFVGLVQGDITFHDPEFHKREITLLASRNATARDFDRVIQEMEKGTVRAERWITHRLGLDEVPGRFAGLTRDPELVKALVDLS